MGSHPPAIPEAPCMLALGTRGQCSGALSFPGGPLVRSDAPPGGMCFPALGVLDYRVLGTNFRDHAIVFTQLEFKDEAFSTVELYSRTELVSQEAMRLFARWSKGLGFLPQ
ncbi:epididymal-specific lipocalin-6, partial [Ailuropoda melanoleuca]|uniref:epididymal-specific lipocalin-6 n=1 Tax=Ailuropoda melanoleuca TaxID=9646 RepID=UPI0014947662